MGSVDGLRKGVIVLVIAVFLVGWVIVLPPVGAKGSFVAYDAAAHRFTVSPTGTDDTANIQAAFDGCAADGSRCTVQLTSGTFHTAQIVVHNFLGSFQGMGESKTTIRALPNLPVTKDHPFNAHLPGADNPWPNLFTFFDGTYSLSELTFTEPYAVPTQRYLAYDTPGWTDALHAFIQVTGVHANVTVDHVTMIGGAGDFSVLSPFSFNVVDGIFAQALVLQPGAKDSSFVLPLQVTFQATNSVFSTVNDGLAFMSLVDSTVSASRNVFDTVEWGVGAAYLSNSVTTVTLSEARNVLGHAAVEAYNSGSGDPLLGCERPSQFLVTDNDFHLGFFGRGALFVDFAYLTGCPRSMDAVVTGNTIHMDDPTALAIQSDHMRSTTVTGNTILGAGYAGVLLDAAAGSVASNEIRGSGIGVWLNGAQGVLVQGNDITDSGQWGIALLVGYYRGFRPLPPSDNLIEQNVVTGSGQFDLYWDGTGTGNVWTGNMFQTEYPPGLNT